MGGLDDVTIRECDLEWVFCLAFVADGDVWEDEVYGGTGVSNCFVGTQGYVD